MTRAVAEPTPRRGVVRALLRAAVVVGVLLTPLAHLDADGLLPFVQALLPAVGLLGLVVATGLTVMRDPTALVAVAAGLALLAPVLPLQDRPPVPQGRGDDLRIAALNVEFGGADPVSLVEHVRRSRPDVLVLLEVTPRHWRDLRATDLASLLPHATGTLETGAGGTVILTRSPVTCPDPARACGRVVPASARPDPADASQDTFTQIDIRLADGTVLRGAHPFPPRPGRLVQWRAGLERLGGWITDHADERRLVVAGDLNSGPVHPLFRRVAQGLVPAPRSGLPWTRTWPRESGLPPFVQIDHVLSRGFAVVDEGTFTVPGTDHAGVWATLRPIDAEDRDSSPPSAQPPTSSVSRAWKPSNSRR